MENYRALGDCGYLGRQLDYVVCKVLCPFTESQTLIYNVECFNKTGNPSLRKFYHRVSRQEIFCTPTLVARVLNRSVE